MSTEIRKTDTPTPDFREILNDLFEHKVLLLLCACTVTVCCSLVLFFRAPIYESSVLLQISGKQNALGKFSNTAQSAILLGSSENETTAIQMALIKSPFILLPALQSLHLDTLFKPKKSKNTLLLDSLTLSEQHKNIPLRLYVDAPDHFVLESPNHSILLQGPVGPLIVNETATESIQVRALKGPVGAEFTLTQSLNPPLLKSILKRLQISDLGLAATGPGSKTGILRLSLSDKDPLLVIQLLNAIAHIAQQKNMEQKTLEAEKMLLFVEQQLPKSKAALDAAEHELSDYLSHSGKINLTVQAESILRSLAKVDEQIEILRLNRSELLQENTPEHPTVLAINAQEQALEKHRNTLFQHAQQFPADQQRILNLTRSIKVKEALYTLLLQKQQEIEISKASILSDIQILSPARNPDPPPSNLRWSNLSICFILGLALGTALIFIKKAFLQHVNDPHWLEQNSEVVNIAVIPFSAAQKAKSLLAKSNPDDLSVEALRGLRTTLQLILCSAQNNLISLMGPSPGIGKSFVSANLAYLLADSGKRILLIDGDIRKGHLNDYVNQPRAGGLVDLILGKAALAEVLHETDHPNLTFLSTGEYPENPSEILMNKKFPELLKHLSTLFDIVLIDTAPILAVTDGVLVGALCGANFLVTGSHKHQPEELRIAIHRAKNAGLHFAGYIFNYLREESALHRSHLYKYHYYDYRAKPKTQAKTP